MWTSEQTSCTSAVISRNLSLLDDSTISAYLLFVLSSEVTLHYFRYENRFEDHTSTVYLLLLLLLLLLLSTEVG